VACLFLSNTCTFIVGNLPRDIREGELDHEFRRYGRVERIDVKNGFAFVEFDHERDADRAVRDLDDRTVFGRRIRVEPAHSDRRYAHLTHAFWITLYLCSSYGGPGH